MTLFYSVFQATNPVALKYAVDQAPPLFVGWVRMLFIALFLYIILKARKMDFSFPTRTALLYTVLASLAKSISLILLLIGFQHTQVVRALVIMKASPLLLLVLSHYFVRGDRLTALKTASVMLGFAGVAYLVLERGGAISASMNGDLLMVGHMIFVSLMVLFEKKALDLGVTPAALVFYNSVGNFIVMCPLGLATETVTPELFTFRFVAAMLFLIFVSGLFTFVLRRYILLKTSISFMQPFSYLDWLLAVIFSAALLGESALDKNVLIAMGFVLAGLALLTLKKGNQT